MNTKTFYGLCAVISSFVLFCVAFTIYTICTAPSNDNLNVSLPEEIKVAEQNDKLIVLSVSDSIYLGYDNKTEYDLELINNDSIRVYSVVSDTTYYCHPNDLLQVLVDDNQ